MRAAVFNHSFDDCSLQLRQVFLEMRDCALPGKLGGFLVVAFGGVVVEPMPCSGIGLHHVIHVVGLERGLVAGLCRIDAFVIARVIDQHGCLDPRDIL